MLEYSVICSSRQLYLWPLPVSRSTGTRVVGKLTNETNKLKENFPFLGQSMIFSYQSEQRPAFVKRLFSRLRAY